ncbi:MAG TPA: DNA ligase, partial [Bacillota bacterium]
RLAFSEDATGSGRSFFEASVRAGLEGIVAKRRTSVYRPGERSADWLKVAHEHRRPFVIGGVTSGRHYGIGALLVGAWDPARPERLTYLGHVGAGFGHGRLRELIGRLRASPTSPFHQVPRDRREATWVRPDVVCIVGYRELTSDRRLRHPVYRGLDPETDAAACLVPWATGE